MLTFQRLTLGDIDALRPFFAWSTTRACDNTVGGAFMWRDFFRAEFALYEQTLILKVDYFGATAFAMPLGEHPAAALSAVHDYCRAQGFPMVVCTATADDVAILQSLYKIAPKPEPDWNDYLYLASDLAAMSGRRYHGQRNHINFFMKNYSDYVFESVTADNLPDVQRFFDAYHVEIQKDSAVFREEQIKVGEVLGNYALYGMDGLLLRVNGRVISFALGEAQGDTVFVHAEKTDQSFRGANQMIAQAYAQRHMERGILYVNREEDVGDPGLRTSKLSYHPHNILEKFTVAVLED